MCSQEGNAFIKIMFHCCLFKLKFKFFGIMSDQQFMFCHKLLQDIIIADLKHRELLKLLIQLYDRYQWLCKK